MIIAIISVILYQIFQKDISDNINPAVSLIITYVIALLVSMILYFTLPSNGSFIDSIKDANYASYFLGFAVVGIEIGFLLVYRSGWKLSLAAPFSSSVTNIMLISIGFTFYKAQVTRLNLLGLLFCIAGIFLISMKK